ncbi:hypothetical protein LEP1GSC125_3153 [Leptospira mayottensis 200901122]|uniref:Uncharacterized protein n=1 Tax=Leptospira mayottensis 200901122 TaxID=1193010 RepID=A0AA87MM70_9LEPT|nr:hypothetical protein LEP1GSC125_3153 [Leptospira mayottensis 200901122]
MRKTYISNIIINRKENFEVYTLESVPKPFDFIRISGDRCDRFEFWDRLLVI